MPWAAFLSAAQEGVVVDFSENPGQALRAIPGPTLRAKSPTAANAKAGHSN